MPLEPVTEYDEARYPTLEEMGHRRRDFLRRIGLAAVAAAYGPHVIGCANGSDTIGGGPLASPTPAPPTPAPTTPAPTPVALAGIPAPPHWPGPRGAIVGGGPIEVKYADGVTGWVAVAAVFDPSNERLESALVDAEARVAAIVRQKLGRERSGFLADADRVHAVEAAILEVLRAVVGMGGLLSIAVSAVNPEAARRPAHAANAPVVAPPAMAAAPAANVPELAAPMIAPPATTAQSEARRHLPRAGALCPIHGSGCRRSDTGGAGTP